MTKILKKEVSRKKKIIFGLIGLVSISLVSLLVYKFILVDTDVVDNQNIDLLAQISRNASKSVPSNNTRLDNVVDEAFAMPHSYFKDGYYEDVYTYTAGPAIDKCKSYNYYELLPGEYITISSKSYLNESISVDEYKTVYNGDELDQYYLSNSNGSYNYMGGSYAVFTPYTDNMRVKGVPQPMPAIDYMESDENPELISSKDG